MPSFDSDKDVFNLQDADAAIEEFSFASRLRAEEFRAEDLDGILEGVSGSGNLNFAVLQAGLADGAALDGDGMSAGFAGADIGSAAALSFGRQAIGDAAQSYGAALPAAPAFGGSTAFSGNGPLYIDDLAGPKALQSSSGAANGSSFSAQFSVAPIGAAIHDDAGPAAPPVATGPDISPGDGSDGETPPTARPEGPGDPAGPGGPGGPQNPEGPEGPGGGDPERPGIDEVLDIVTDVVTPVVDPVLDLVDDLAGTLDGLIETLPLDPVVDLVGDALDGVTETLDPVTDIADGLQAALLGGAEEIANGLLTGVADLGDALFGETLLGDVTGALPGLANLLDVPSLGGVVDDALTGAVDLIDTLTSGGLGGTVDGVTDAVSNLIDGGVGDYLDSVLKNPASLADGLDGLLDSVAAPIGGLPADAVLDHALTVVDDVLDEALGGELGDLLGGVSNGLNDLAGGAGVDVLDEGPLGDVVDAATDMTGGVGGALDDILDEVSDGLDEAIGSIADPLDGAADDIEEVVEDVLDGVGEAIGGVTDGLGDTLEKVADPVDDLLGGGEALDGLGDIIGDLLGGAGDEGTSDGDGLLGGLLPGGGEDPLVEIDSALPLNGDNATGDTAEDGEGSLLDIDIVAPLDTGALADADSLGDALDGAGADISLGGGDSIDPVELVDGVLEGVDEALDAADSDGITDDLDVDSLLTPLNETVDSVLDLLDAQESETGLSLDISDTGELGGDLIGDIIINDGDGLFSGSDESLDLPDPDAILSEGLPLVDEGLGGLLGGGGGLFG